MFFCLDIFDPLIEFYLKEKSSRPHSLWVNSPFGLCFFWGGGGGGGSSEISLSNFELLLTLFCWLCSASKLLFRLWLIKAGFYKRRSRSRIVKTVFWDLLIPLTTPSRYESRSSENGRKQKRKNWTNHKAWKCALWLVYPFVSASDSDNLVFTRS